MVRDHLEEIGEYGLVLVGSNLQHGWFTHKCTSKEIREVTIQFHKDLFDERMLRHNQLSFIRAMLEISLRGILFSILHDLSVSRNMRILSDSTFNNIEPFTYNSRRIEKALEHMNTNFDKAISLSDIARLANMSDVAFSRFFKTRTGNNFIDSLIEIRLGHATRMLIETTNQVGDIAFRCGLNNMSNFNRVFKKKKGCTPKEFRGNYNAVGSGPRVFI